VCKRVFIIANPKAGSMDVDQFSENLDGVFAESNHTYKLYFTQPDEDVAATLNKAIQDGWDVIAAAGGDGTVSMVADGLQGLGVPLGILPMGTGNVLAQELGIPQELGQAAGLILGEHKRRPVDGMKIHDHLYLLYAGVGISSAIMEDASQQSKRRFGQVAYVWAGLKKLAGWQPVHFKLEIDGRKLSSSAVEIGVTNTRIAGGRHFEWGKRSPWMITAFWFVLFAANPCWIISKFSSIFCWGEQIDQSIFIVLKLMRGFKLERLPP
jgi:diacylglycerol kinase (ATP)